VSISSQNLGEALLWVAAGIAVLALIAGLAVWIARRRGSRTIAIDAADAVARVWLFVCAVGLVFVVWRAMSGSEMWIETLPATLSWPEQPPCDAAPAGGAAVVTCASVTSVSASIAQLSAGVRAVIAAGAVLAVIASATPALLITIVCRQTFRGVPFSRSASRAFLLAAVVLLVAGTGAELTSGIGASLAAAEALPRSGAELTSNGVFSVTLPLWPIGAAIALAALGAVFRHGGVLQRETEGLV
jgi:hypothetical protein